MVVDWHPNNDDLMCTGFCHIKIIVSTLMFYTPTNKTKPDNSIIMVQDKQKKCPNIKISYALIEH